MRGVRDEGLTAVARTLDRMRVRPTRRFTTPPRRRREVVRHRRHAHLRGVRLLFVRRVPRSNASVRSPGPLERHVSLIAAGARRRKSTESEDNQRVSAFEAVDPAARLDLESRRGAGLGRASASDEGVGHLFTGPLRRVRERRVTGPLRGARRRVRRILVGRHRRSHGAATRKRWPRARRLRRARAGGLPRAPPPGVPAQEAHGYDRFVRPLHRRDHRRLRRRRLGRHRERPRALRPPRRPSIRTKARLRPPSAARQGRRGEGRRRTEQDRGGQDRREESVGRQDRRPRRQDRRRAVPRARRVTLPPAVCRSSIRRGPRV